MMYASGVFDVDTCCVEQNHALTLVGYGHDETTGLDYWLAQNRYVRVLLGKLALRSYQRYCAWYRNLSLAAASLVAGGCFTEVAVLSAAPRRLYTSNFSLHSLYIVGALVGERPATSRSRGR
jgi:hypothetical protein